MLRIAVIGTEMDVAPLLASAERLPNIECVAATLESGLQHFDAVVFVGFHDDGAQSICNVARDGKHLLIDLATLKTVAEAEAVITCCRAADVQLMISQPLRYLPSVKAVRESLDAGELGEPGLLRIHRWMPGQTKSLASLLVREIDLANYLFDRSPATVYGVARGEEPSRYIQVHFGYDGGAMAIIDITTNLPEGDDYYSLSLIGANGSAYADDHHNRQLLFGGGHASAQLTGQITFQWTEQLSEFAAAINRPPHPDINSESALTCLRVTEAVRRAIDSGSAMHWQGEIYEPA